MQPLNLAQHTWSTAVFSVAAATLVPVLITLCFAARAFVVGVVAARPRATVCVGCVVGCCVALREATARVVVDCVAFVVPVFCGARETRAGAVAERATVSWRVALNAADVHAKITNAKDKRFKRNPFYCSLHFIIKKRLVQVGCIPESKVLLPRRSGAERRRGGGNKKKKHILFSPPPRPLSLSLQRGTPPQEGNLSPRRKD